MVKVGDAVIYVDPLARPRPALVTAVWGGPMDEHAKSVARAHGVGTPEEIEAAIAAQEKLQPSLNLVFVSEDKDRDDTYGRQIERQTSIPHRTNQAAHGNYWMEMPYGDIRAA